MEEIELYHVHKCNSNDKKWQVNNIIKVDENFDSVMSKRHNNFNQNVTTDQGLMPYYQYLLTYLPSLLSKNVLKGEDLALLKQLMCSTYDLTFNANFFRREQALEECRRSKYIDLPSRLHSVYLCDKDGLDYWSDQISENGKKDTNVYKVVASGKVFKTNEQLLPGEDLCFEDAINASYKYWNPKMKDCPLCSNEYLAQGKIQIIEKIK